MTAATALGPEVTDLDDLAEGALLSEATEIEAVLREGEVHELRIAYQWAVAHPAVDARETSAGPAVPSVLTEPETLGGAGTPEVAAFTSEPVGVTHAPPVPRRRTSGRPAGRRSGLVAERPGT